MKNKKAVGVIAVIAVIIIGVCAGYFIANRSNDEAESQAQTTAAAVTESTVPATTQVASTEAETEAQTTEPSVDITFAKKGYWYLYDEDSRVAYAFAFEGTSKVKLAYFNTDNINGEDAKFYTGDATFSVKDDKLIINNLPSDSVMNVVELTVKDSKLYFNNRELENKEELSLDIPFEHFN